MSTPATCPQCGVVLPNLARQGLCPACLLKVGLAGQSKTELPVSDPGLAPTIEHTPSGQAARQELKLPEPGEQFGGYRIVRILGRGGMGAVYEADQLETGRRVALKVLKHSLDSPEARKRFLREGRLAASINHPNSVYVYGTEEIQGTPAISMEIVAGGTLQELVKKRGPLPIGEAVDMILQIMAGLEAAQKLGVLHRDIKPANCFVDVDGSVKVGDFGLSISTAPRGESDLTHSGSFLGTPAFSSPEQLRGDELNLRSDMYAVGVTLYYLLTGKTPFDADNMVKLLATVLEKKPESPQKYRPEIPRGLAAVVLRCLEKQPTDRFRDYAELRQALLPFASAAPTPATLGLRFAAAVLDGLILMPLVLLLTFPLIGDLERASDPKSYGGWLGLELFLAQGLVRILYFALLEGLWGLTPGKAFCRLRVVGPDRTAPGIPRALMRVCTFYALPSIPAWAQFVLGNSQATEAWAIQLLTWGILLAMFGTARRLNGFAALHDLLSGTRIISREAYQSRQGLASNEELPEATATAQQIGPYQVLGALTAGGDAWLLGYDTRLLRRVWIHKAPAGTPPIESKLRNLGRIGRLRWLTGCRGATENWDAYEAASGEALLGNLRPHPWGDVRFWLLDLAEELASAAKDGTTPSRLALDSVWITAEGRAKLLDFPAPGISPSSKLAGDTREFLSQVAVTSLEGRIADSGESRLPATPLPIRAREFLQSLPQLVEPEGPVPALRALVQQPAIVTRGKRLALVLGCCLPTLVGALFAVLIYFVLHEWQTNHPQIQPLFVNLALLENQENALRELEKQGAANASGLASPSAEQIAAMEVYIAHRFGATIADPKQWSSPYAVAIIKGPQRSRAEQIVAAHPHVSEMELHEAEKVLGPLVDQASQREIHRGQNLGGMFFIGIFTIGWLMWVAILSILAAITFRRGLLLWALGLDIVTHSGAAASRLRLLGRSLIAWSPLVLGPVAMALVTPALHKVSPDAGLALTLTVACGATYLTLVLWSALMPNRGIPDRLAGTWLVPR